MAKVPNWLQEYVKNGRPRQGRQIVEIMRRAGLKDNLIAHALEEWMYETNAATSTQPAQGPAQAQSPKSPHLTHLSTLLQQKKIDDIRAYLAKLSPTDRQSLIQQLQDIVASAAPAPAAPAPARTTPQRPVSEDSYLLEQIRKELKLSK